jgi:hypothetical protein
VFLPRQNQAELPDFNTSQLGLDAMRVVLEMDPSHAIPTLNGYSGHTPLGWLSDPLTVAKADAWLREYRGRFPGLFSNPEHSVCVIKSQI